MKGGLFWKAPLGAQIRDWASKLGYGAEALAEANRKAIDLLCEIRDEFESEKTPMVISGCIGPRGDGYVPAETIRRTKDEGMTNTKPSPRLRLGKRMTNVEGMTKHECNVLARNRFPWKTRVIVVRLR